MLPLRFWPLVCKQVVRQRTRTLLTLAGVATAMFLFCVVEAVQLGLREATEASARDTTLVVYRENRFCPFTSRLPEHYASTIRKLPGVVRAEPLLIVVSNCRTSLDVVTFRGVDPVSFASGPAAQFHLRAGSLSGWQARSDAALVGAALAGRRGLRPGDRFDAGGVIVTVAAVFDSDAPQDKNVAYVHLPFLQRAAGRNSQGIVTQFNVQVSGSAQLEPVARAIDAQFHSDSAPTSTRGEKAFIARAAGDLVELIRFTRWLGLGAVAAVFALVANTVVLSVQDRVREIAVLQTLGFRGALVARLIVAESLLISLAGGALGALAALAALHFGHFSLSNEGISVNFEASPSVLFTGLGVSVLLGVLAGLVPAWQAARAEIVTAFRAV